MIVGDPGYMMAHSAAWGEFLEQRPKVKDLSPQERASIMWAFRLGFRAGYVAGGGEIKPVALTEDGK